MILRKNTLKWKSSRCLLTSAYIIWALWVADMRATFFNIQNFATNACTHIVKLIIELFCDSDLQFFVLSIMPNRRRYLYQHKLEKALNENFIVSNIDMERFSVCSLGNSGSSGSTMSSVWLINDDSYGWRLSAISSSRLEIPNVPYCFDSHDLQKFN